MKHSKTKQCTFYQENEHKGWMTNPLKIANETEMCEHPKLTLWLFESIISNKSVEWIF